MNKHTHQGRHAVYKKDSLSLVGAVSLGTSVMIGAGIVGNLASTRQ